MLDPIFVSACYQTIKSLHSFKPGNIFVCERGGTHDVIKLLDFGLVHVRAENSTTSGKIVALSRGRQMVKAASALATAAPRENWQLTQAGQLLGTPAYMAPEQITGKQPDARSDLYSLGGLAIFLLTGRPPFERDSLEDLCSAHLSAPPPRLRDRNPQLPVDLETLIVRCLAKEPDERVQTAEELSAMFDAIETSDKWDSAQAKAWWLHHTGPMSQGDSETDTLTTPDGLAETVSS